MQIQYIYKSDINRDINGVIKVAQNDEKSMQQELSEYIITKELRKHFNTFFTNYEKSLTTPTDKIGVWISGFFGSGKSHFLKMLSYLLSNNVVAGKHAVEYFADKFDDPMMFAQVEHCASVPTDTILFNIDSKSPINKDKTAILRVFAKVFYEQLGFYGNDLKVAKLEQFIAKSGKTEEFRTKFAEINGDEWVNVRDTFAFFEDDVVECLTSVLDMSETSARNWFNGEENAEMSIEQLVKEIKEYVDSKGKDYRLLFMIDEVGQYIGSDSDLMLNLQTIVEEIGTNCEGKVWVVVTSQEAIDSITKISGNDFSKIQGRFNTRLSLSSSSVDEVIKKRILAKNDNAEKMLRMNYGKNSAVLKNLFSFNDAVLDLKGYSGEDDFIETYPFVPYQFRLMQNVLAEIRKHGNSGKHLSGGERSMLSGFQEAAQAIEDKDENALAPFSLFYNTVHTFLESAIRRVIDRCQNAADSGDGIEQYDVSILKLLYLIRYVDDIKSNVDNITTLMVERIDADKINMRKSVQESLDRLLSQNYVARNGDTYTFLTDDEQDIAREIRNTTVDSAQITQAIAQIIFGDLYVSKKFRYEKYDFPFDQMVDDTNIGTPTGAIKLRVVTVASDLYSGGEQLLIMKSATDNEAIVVLSDEFPYFEEIENSMKIRKYVKSRNVAQLPETIQSIIRGRQQQASLYEKRAKEFISEAIINGKFYADGENIVLKAGGVKEKFDAVLSSLVEGVYSKLKLVRKGVESDAEILGILSKVGQQLTLDGENINAEALKEIEQYLEMQGVRMLPTSMGDIQKRFQGVPYGWREIDIAALVATLVAEQKVTVTYGGSIIQPGDVKFPDYLRRRFEIDKAIVTRRVAISDGVIKKSREFLREYFNAMDVPADEDELIAFVIDKFTEQQTSYQKILSENYSFEKYPDKQVIENGIKLCGEILLQKKDNTALLNKMIEKQDDLLDLSEDIADVLAFFKNQRQVFDSASSLYDTMNAEKDYIQADDRAMRDLMEIGIIIRMPKPYKRISELPTLIQSLQDKYLKLMDSKKEDVLGNIQSAMGEIHQTATSDQIEIVRKADAAFDAKKKAMNEATSLTQLDAMKIQIENIRNQYLKALVVEEKPEIKTVTVNRANICYTSSLKTEEDIDKYLADVKKRLLEMLDGQDVLHII